jgi:hypothetical protein
MGVLLGISAYAAHTQGHERLSLAVGPNTADKLREALALHPTSTVVEPVETPS